MNAPFRDFAAGGPSPAASHRLVYDPSAQCNRPLVTTASCSSFDSGLPLRGHVHLRSLRDALELVTEIVGDPPR